MAPVIALTIAGSDPGGGAGLQADLKTFQSFGVYGTTVVTLITVQNTVRSSRVEMLDAELVGEQLDAVLEDLPPQAIKTGALGTAAIIEAIASRNFTCPLVIDPVMLSKHGGVLLATEARSAFKSLLLPKAALITPNLDEAMELAGTEDVRDSAKRIADFGVPSVLIKGGHMKGDPVDLLWHDGVFTEFRAARIETRHTHGTGCAYSAAIAACLAQGLSIPESVGKAKEYIHEAIRTAPGLGNGNGPLNFHRIVG